MGVDGPVDHAHTASAQLVGDSVMSESLADHALIHSNQRPPARRRASIRDPLYALEIKVNCNGLLDLLASGSWERWKGWSHGPSLAGSGEQLQRRGTRACRFPPGPLRLWSLRSRASNWIAATRTFGTVVPRV